VFNSESDVLGKPLYPSSKSTVAHWLINQNIDWVCSPKEVPDLLARLLAKKGGVA
jgi:hypothetical protein